MSVIWHDGAPAPSADWPSVAASFLGSGYRVVTPLLPDPLAAARAQARSVLDRLGIDWDDAPWEQLGGTEAVEVTGGASYDAARRAFGPAWTRVTPLPLPTAPTASAAAADLPWTWPSDGPLAGLPTISGLAEDAASRHLPPGTVGLWWNHRDELCTTTAGPLLLRLDEGWVHPDAGAGAVGSWAHARVCSQVDTRPVAVTRAVLARAHDVVAVDPLGVWTTLR